MKRAHRHHHSLWRRGIYSVALLTVLLAIGTIGLHAFEGMGYLDAFYFMSMVATAQGPVLAPHTTGGKLFTAFMAFVSVGAVTAALGYLFGPFFTRIWRISVHKLEAEEKLLAAKFKERR